ncbi:hypothetical protein INS49_004633 [Diaporthe citri]|uniref:uncharacterized protein n=1 Tax=Diaporthe citri TaxID=83186 RepID=UPI001C81F338|nr:uncharacterized protein INS49_004633 [Diaporthe citri]KAG6354615.1 hypothetical protein INS49_004633 [Diaporthe citri]
MGGSSTSLRQSTNTKSVEKAAQEVKGQLGSSGLDVLINNAAIQQHSPNNKMEDFSPADFSRIHLVGPHRVITAVLPLLRAGTQKKIINISSTMGSIAWADAMNIAQGSAYKVSKAGFHMLNKQFSLDLAEEGFTCLLVSPGWLKTDLGTDYGDFTVDVGAAEMKRIILASTPAQNGKFLNIHVPGHENSPGRHDGKEIEW